MRSGLKSGCCSTMAIMVGTITVWLTLYSSMRSRTWAGSYSGMNTDWPPRAGTLEEAREQEVGEHALGARVVEDERQLLGRQAQVQRIDDAGTQIAGVIQLEVLVTVEGEHGNPVALLDAEFAAEGVGKTQHPVTVLVPGAVVVAVVEPDPRT